ncbi:TetR family transcriptional regulator [Actinocorallia longicatena]|uniref:TetR family transcriptional regulator n=2 Tax=Actinocorallia longicatena TaxID=111803 RepID=A0ABP6QIH1_9ACTN
MAERKRQVVREELGEVALKLLAVQGFEGTTIEQIVAAAGVSRRTFFRYFKSKEDVIIEFLGDLGDFMLAELVARPVDEPPLVALRRAFGAAVDLIAEFPQKSVALARLTLCTPVLRGRYLDRQADLAREMAAELARRAGVPARDLRLELTAAVALTAYALSLERWSEDGGDTDLGALLNEAFAAIPGQDH